MPPVKRFLPAILLAALVVLTSPFIGRVRDFLFAQFPHSAVRGLAVALAALAAGLFLFAVLRIRRRRGLRYAGLVLLVVLLWLQTAGFRTGLPTVDVVEKIHIIEYGLLAYLLYRAFRPAADLTVFLLPLVWVAFAGTLEEWVQWLVPARVGDVRDVLLNASAGSCGLLFGLCLEPPAGLRWRLAAGQWRTVTRSAALVVVAAGLFFCCAHLGYEIEDPEIGRFRSWHTAAELRELAIRRSRQWAVDPPTGVEIWDTEDYYLTEAAWHANHRNGSYGLGDFYRAWQANRILEKYYDPFLDLESFRGSGKHRYPPNVRRELAAKAPRYDPKSYLSPVLRERIYPWPSKPVFLVVVLTLAAVLVVVPEIVRAATRSQSARFPPSVPGGHAPR